MSTASPLTPTAPVPGRSRRWRVALLAGVVALLPLAVPQAAAADEVHPRQDTYALSGHGWGHGRGMSQQGAHGAALSGLTYTRIVSFYYPSTTLTTAADGGIRVILSGDHALTNKPSTSLDVEPAPGLRASADGQTLLLPSGRDRWRVVSTGAGKLKLQGRSGGVWRDQVLYGTTVATAGPLQLSETDGVLRRWYPGEKARDYRGTLRGVVTGTTTMAAVNHLPMESYLRAVVPAEMPSGWHLEALKAQSVAARSYSTQRRTETRARFPDQAWDICDSTACQVYAGATAETARTDQAIAATARQLLVYGGAPVFAEFSASNGGWTVKGSFPYQVAKADPYDGVTGSESHSWKALITATEIERAFPAVGRLLRLRVVSRDGNGEWGGRVQTVVLEGVDGAGRATSVTTTGRAIYLASPWPSRPSGLRSNWWKITSTPASNPTGSLDSVTTSSTGERIRGWALDRDTTDPVRVHVYVDGRATLSAAADAPRPDVGAAFPGYGDDHGFDLRLTLPDGAREVCVWAINAAGSGGSNVKLGCRSVTVRHQPFGTVDRTGFGPGTLTAAGWAIDPDTDASIGVRLLLDGTAVGSVTADDPRPDVGRAYPAYGELHGWATAFPAPAAEGTRTLCAVGVNAAGTPGADRAVACRQVTVRHSPTGSLDSATAGSGAVTVRGWTLDPDTADPLTVHVYVDGKPVKAATASTTRTDVGRAYPGFGDQHGYQVTVPTTPGTHTVCTYALNAAGTPGSHVRLGCRSVTA